MKIGDYVKTPRFSGVTIDKVFNSQMDALAAGYTEPTHYHKDGWGIYGKHIAFKDGFVKFSWGAYKEGK